MTGARNARMERLAVLYASLKRASDARRTALAAAESSARAQVGQLLAVASATDGYPHGLLAAATRRRMELEQAAQRIAADVEDERRRGLVAEQRSRAAARLRDDERMQLRRRAERAALEEVAASLHRATGSRKPWER